MTLPSSSPLTACACSTRGLTRTSATPRDTPSQRLISHPPSLLAELLFHCVGPPPRLGSRLSPLAARCGTRRLLSAKVGSASDLLQLLQRYRFSTCFHRTFFPVAVPIPVHTRFFGSPTQLFAATP